MAGFKFGNKANFGENSTLSGSFQYVFGSGNSNSADYTMVGGISNTVVSTGEEGFVWGSGNTVSGSHSAVIGKNNTVMAGGDFNLMAGLDGVIKGNDWNLMVGDENSSAHRGNFTWGRKNINDTDEEGLGYQMVGGSGNTVSGANYGICVGDDNIAPSNFRGGLQFGRDGLAPENTCGAITTAAGKFTTNGDAQLTSHMVYRGQTTNNTATVIYNMANSTNDWNLAANDSILVKATVIGRKAGDAGQTAAYEVIATFKNQGGTTSIGTTGVTKRVLNEDTGTTNYDATLAANDTLDTFELKVTGDTGHNVNWMANVEVLKLNVA